jgi:hypothetical protein
MEEEKRLLIAEIDRLIKEREKINMRSQIFTEVISHLRSRISKNEARKAEIHHEVLDLRARVLAWEAVSKDNKKD